MPYITTEEYKVVRKILAPEVPQGGEADDLERAIYTLNQQIKDLPGTGPTEEWRDLLFQHCAIPVRLGGARR